MARRLAVNPTRSPWPGTVDVVVAAVVGGGERSGTDALVPGWCGWCGWCGWGGWGGWCRGVVQAWQLALVAVLIKVQTWHAQVLGAVVVEVDVLEI